jgi:hypothetical protein
VALSNGDIVFIHTTELGVEYEANYRSFMPQLQEIGLLLRGMRDGGLEYFQGARLQK